VAKKILQVVETAYRATLEEQDDTVVWLTHAMKGAGGDFSLLLRGNAVNYVVRGQDASGLAFGERRQTQSPRLDEDVAKLAGKGVPVYYVAEDARDRGLPSESLLGDAKPVSRAEIPRLFESHDMVWHW
jgi:hypothetical protein